MSLMLFQSLGSTWDLTLWRHTMNVRNCHSSFGKTHNWEKLCVCKSCGITSMTITYCVLRKFILEAKINASSLKWATTGSLISSFNFLVWMFKVVNFLLFKVVNFPFSTSHICFIMRYFCFGSDVNVISITEFSGPTGHLKYIFYM